MAETNVTNENAGLRIVLIGFPSDEGVRRNHGRFGAALAPAEIRKALSKLAPEADDAARSLLAGARDLGDVVVTGDVEADQARLAESVAPWLREGAIPMILGGGHETAFGHFLAHAASGQDISILNWDAHPDVRPLNDGKGHSGSPFRQAILDASGRCRRYIVAGLLPARLVPEHLEFVTQHGGAYHWRSEITPSAIEQIYASLAGPLMVSFDMDAVDRSFAPGVSAPAEGGLTRELWLQAARRAGRHPSTLSMDLVEVNPRVDPDGRTSLLAAETLLAFVAGVSQRTAVEAGSPG